MSYGDLPTDQPATVCGVVERVAFHNTDTDWSVLRVRLTDPRMLEQQTLVGHTHAQPGQEISALGVWKSDPSWGRQFAATKIVAAAPTGVDGITRYLGSGMIPGIGPATARLIVAAFGTATIHILNQEPARLLEVKGIGPKKRKVIQAGWQEQKAVSEIMLFLNEQQIPPYLCKRIYRRYQEKSIEVLRADPYKLALEVSGIGFKSADAIARQLNIPKNSRQRIRAALVFLMQEGAASGHCGMHRAELVARTAELLGLNGQQIVDGLDYDLAQGSSGGGDCSMLVEHDSIVFLTWLSSAEEYIARSLVEMTKQVPRWKIDADNETDIAQFSLNITLARQQREAVVMMLTSKISVMTGGPGVGKTATLKLLLHILRRNKVSVALAAPTGKAAQRATEATGISASTVHRLLGIKAGEIVDAKTEVDVLIIDEAPMLDVPIMNIILRALSSHTALILVGDIDQLASIGPGQVFSDIIGSGIVPVTRLTEVYRQAAGSLIIKNAHFINKGELPVKGEPTDDFFVVAVNEKDRHGNRVEIAALATSVVSTVVDLVATRLPARYGFDPFSDIMVLSPMNGTTSGVNNLNAVLQQRLNPSPPKSVMRFGTRYGVGDKVIQTRNNYDLNIFNGDTGRILDLNEEDKEALLDFNGNRITMPYDDMDELRLAYAMTIHKAQGSQCPAVVIPVTTQHYMMLQRNLLYTGITRAQRLVVLVGMWRAIGMAVANNQAMKRISRLARLLSSSASPFGQGAL